MFVGFVSHERLQLVAGIDLYVRYQSPSINFCYGEAFADAPEKGTSLTLTTQTVPICNGENCSVDDSLYSVARP